MEMKYDTLTNVLGRFRFLIAVNMVLLYVLYVYALWVGEGASSALLKLLARTHARTSVVGDAVAAA